MQGPGARTPKRFIEQARHFSACATACVLGQKVSCAPSLAAAPRGSCLIHRLPPARACRRYGLFFFFFLSDRTGPWTQSSRLAGHGFMRNPEAWPRIYCQPVVLSPWGDPGSLSLPSRLFLEHRHSTTPSAWGGIMGYPGLGDILRFPGSLPAPVILDCQCKPLILPFPGTHIKSLAWDAGSLKEPKQPWGRAQAVPTGCGTWGHLLPFSRASMKLSKTCPNAQS